MSLQELMPFEAESEYPIWSPYDSHAAAEALLEMLKAEVKPKGSS